MKIKKGLSLILISGILMITGCQSKSTMNKSEISTNKNTNQNVEANQSINKEQAKEIAIKAFEKYFNKKINVKNLFEEVELEKNEAKDNQPKISNWHVCWSTFNITKLKDLDEQMKIWEKANNDDEKKIGKKIDKLNNEYKKALTYWAIIDEKSGKILNIGMRDGRRNSKLSNEELEKTETKLKEKTIALNELEKFEGKKIDITKLNEEINVKGNEFEFVWSNDVDWTNNTKERKVIEYYVTINKETGEIQEIGNGNEILKNSAKQPTYPNYSTEEGKKIAFDFIKKHKYVANMNDMKFLRYMNADPEIALFEVDFTYGKDEKTENTKVIRVYIDKSNNDVVGMSRRFETTNTNENNK
jgi:hypothetical protein